MEQKLVFGLSNRTNRLRHDEYAERRSRSDQAKVSEKAEKEEKAEEKAEEEAERKEEPARMQFNIPPPPMPRSSFGKASVVSYAKSRIYQRPAPPEQGSSPTTNNTSSSRPPKQALVSKAREQWEGGEPFARCRSRQRLAALQAGRRSLQGPWCLVASAVAGAGTGAGGQQPQPAAERLLQRGSVLERVQQFDCSADAADPSKRPPARRRPSNGPTNSSPTIPRFYHPFGRPNTYQLELERKNIALAFERLPERRAQLEGPQASRHFQAIAGACDLPECLGEPLRLYARHEWTRLAAQGPRRRPSSLSRAPLLQQRADGSPSSLTCDQFLAAWRHLVGSAFDQAARLVHLLTLGQRRHLLPEDLVPLVMSVIEHHPGLGFLREAADFHMRYVQTVIARIFYSINKSWTGKISLQEVRQSNLLEVLRALQETEDINSRRCDYFSYEHFYVIYCKFWALDQDHDLLLSKQDLARHQEAAISSRIIDRIFMGVVSREIAASGRMGYSDFVWFLLAEEDKRQARSQEYWFRLMDLDGDGYISMYEMEYFYQEQARRLELMNIEPLAFADSACQMLDLVKPRQETKISLADLKRTKLAPIFFDTFINLEKYLEQESREFVAQRELACDNRPVSDWERYASEEYESLVSEETGV